jgi:hypothetical protein
VRLGGDGNRRAPTKSELLRSTQGNPKVLPSSPLPFVLKESANSLLSAFEQAWERMVTSYAIAGGLGSAPEIEIWW